MKKREKKRVTIEKRLFTFLDKKGFKSCSCFNKNLKGAPLRSTLYITLTNATIFCYTQMGPGVLKMSNKTSKDITDSTDTLHLLLVLFIHSYVNTKGSVNITVI